MIAEKQNLAYSFLKHKSPPTQSVGVFCAFLREFTTFNRMGIISGMIAGLKWKPAFAKATVGKGGDMS